MTIVKNIRAVEVYSQYFTCVVHYRGRKKVPDIHDCFGSLSSSHIRSSLEIRLHPSPTKWLI